MILPKELKLRIPTDRLLAESEWRAIGVQQSLGWVHYMVHKPGNFYIFFFAMSLFLFGVCLFFVFRILISPTVDNAFLRTIKKKSVF